MSSKALTTRQIRVHVLTQSYRFLGMTQVTRAGFLGELNDPTHSAIVMTDVVTAPIITHEKISHHYDAIRIKKDRIVNACMERKEDAGLKMVRAGYEKTNEYEVNITDPSYEYEGILEWAGRFDFSVLISGGMGDFFLITDSRVQSIYTPSLILTSPVIAINKNYLTSFVHRFLSSPKKNDR